MGVRPEDKSEQATFPRRINRRLSFIFGLLFILVLVVGGMSLYLARSIFLSTEEIKRESERIDLVDRMHSSIHHLISALQRAGLRGTTIPDALRQAYLRDLQTFLERYHERSGVEKEVVGGISRIIADLASVSEKIAKQSLNTRDLEALADAEQRIQALAHRLSAAHRAHMEKGLRQNDGKMQLILGFYIAFVLLGSFLIMGSSFFFARAIAHPLRALVQGASAISEGNLHRQVPVTSKDEIGQLSHAFNIMVERLREHEEKLKGLAAIEERERIAQELHDSLAQDVALLHLKLGEVERGLNLDGSREIKETLAEMRKIVEAAYEDVRQAIFGLRTMVSRGLGLVPTLTEYLHDFSELRKIPVELRIGHAEAIRFSYQAEIQLIRIIHEALTNVSKHAEATRSTVKFEREGKFAKVTIEDNGKGFVLEEVMGKGFRFGLQTMRERAEGVGGRFNIETLPHGGTRVIVHLPLGKGSYEAHSSAPGR